MEGEEARNGDEETITAEEEVIVLNEKNKKSGGGRGMYGRKRMARQIRQIHEVIDLCLVFFKNMFC